MVRRPRLYLPNCPLHIIQRGNNRDACFRDDSDYRAYLHFMREAAERYGVSIHAFVLMTNHVHILATPSTENSVSRMMQSIGRRYVQYFNHIYSRTGTLWEGRYKSTLVDTDNYLLTVYRYIELNPVRAGMVEHAADYPWSSYPHNAAGVEIQMLTPHDSYIALGKTSELRASAYRKLSQTHIPDMDIEAIRLATNKSWVLGSEKFIEQFERRVGIAGKTAEHGGDRKSKEYKNQRL
ncbi:transposase [Marinomonas primoryensis]|jgi:putative transposase|uniref:transposase n=1 Tax=Marinomonas primoryensis TaxID=178399 RepID=UPI003703954F